MEQATKTGAKKKRVAESTSKLGPVERIIGAVVAAVLIAGVPATVALLWNLSLNSGLLASQTKINTDALSAMDQRVRTLETDMAVLKATRRAMLDGDQK